jgi:succinoglycan biosynthesis protein ExoO
MPDRPAISVVIPAFRAAATLPETCASLLRQTMTDWEAIIASDDGTDYLAVLAGAGICDGRLRQVSTGAQGSGEGHARKRALAAARAPVIANLDADDLFRPDRLERLLPLALAHGAAVDNTGVHGEDGRLYKRPVPDAVAVAALTLDVVLKPRIPLFPVFRRELAGAGWTSVPFAADVLFNLELLSLTGTMVIHPEPLYLYLKRPGSITQSPDAHATAERGYDAILDLLAAGALRLDPATRRAAIEEFTANRRLNWLFRQWMESGRCASLEDFLDTSANGRAAWVEAELLALEAGAAA